MKLLILSLCVLASSLALVSGQDGMDPYEVPSVQVQETDRQEPKSVEQDQEPEGLERAAAFGHSPIAAGKQPQEEKKPSAKFGPSAVPPPYFQLQGSTLNNFCGREFS